MNFELVVIAFFALWLLASWFGFFLGFWAGAMVMKEKLGK